jgi:hypothetical protein
MPAEDIPTRFYCQDSLEYGSHFIQPSKLKSIVAHLELFQTHGCMNTRRRQDQ